MKHASITTTMNVYGKVMTDTKRLANSRVVQILGEPEPALEQPKMAVGA